MKIIMRVSKYRLISFVMFFLITLLGLSTKTEADNIACVVMDSFKVSNDAVIPGENFDLTFELRNPSNTENVNGIIISFASDMETVEPIYGQSNQYYIDTILAGETKVITITLHATDKITTSSIQFQIDLSYSNIEKSSNEDQISIQIPVTTSSKIEILSTSLPDTVNLGSKARLYVTYKNTGIDDLYNLTMNIMNEKTNVVKKVSIGSLIAGKISYAEAYLDFSDTGEQKMQITFTYEDTKGAKYTTDMYETTVSVLDSGEEDAIESASFNVENKSFVLSYQKIILMVAILIFGVVSVVLLIRLKK